MPKLSLQTQRSKLLLQARLLRRAWRRHSQARRYGRAVLDRSPVLFANSFPKSGTHLLTQIMHGFAALGPAIDSGLPAVVTYEGDTGRQRPETEIVGDLQRLLPGDIAYGHVHALPGAIEQLSKENVAAFFILRDPRDVVVSHAHYITEMESRHIHHLYYRQALPDFDARLSASIAGISGSDLAAAGLVGAQPSARLENEMALPDILARFQPYVGWLAVPQVLLLRFEDLVNQRQIMLEKILQHAVSHGFSLNTTPEKAIQILEYSINPQRSPTFRSGKTGGWRAAFKSEHKALFQQVSGDLLLRLGYETNDDW